MSEMKKVLSNVTTASTGLAATDVEPKDLLTGIEAAMKQLQAADVSTWILISPLGTVYSGKPEEMLRVLMPYHPLLQFDRKWPQEEKT